MKPRSLVALAMTVGCYQTVDLTPSTSDAGFNLYSRTSPPTCLAVTAPARTEWTATQPVAEDGCIAHQPTGEECLLRLDPPPGEPLASWCTAALGRTPSLTEPGRCDIAQLGTVGVPLTNVETAGHGHYLAAGSGGACAYRVRVTGASTGPLRNATLRCAMQEERTTQTACGAPIGATCEVPRSATCVFTGSSCAATAPTVLNVATPQCASNLCASQRAGGQTATFCTCLCAGNPREPDCACVAGMTCDGAAEVYYAGVMHPVRYCTPTR